MATEQVMALDRAISEIEVPNPSATDWTRQVFDVAQQMRTVVNRNRDVFPASIGCLPCGGHALRFHERLLAILRTGGISDETSVESVYILWVIVNGFSLEESRMVEPLEPDVSSAVSEYFAGLPADRYPNLVKLADHFGEVDLDRRFALLIHAFTDGLSMTGRL